MKCPRCTWRGAFKAYGGHMAKKHRKVLLKQLRKARRSPRRRKEGTTHSPRTRTSRRTKRNASGSQSEMPEAPAGFVVETVTYRRT